LLLPIALFALAPALAEESKAEACLRTKVWEGYADGWGVRSMVTAEIEDGRTRAYLVTLYEGNEYQVKVCADERVVNADLLLYDMKGNVIARDSTVGREPELSFKPPATGTYYVVLYAREMVEAGGKGEVAVAVTYR